MKTIFFEDSYIAGFEVTTANDVIKAQELGLHICDKNQNYFDDIVVDNRRRWYRDRASGDQRRVHGKNVQSTQGTKSTLCYF